jgi:hypothetical protein
MLSGVVQKEVAKMKLTSLLSKGVALAALITVALVAPPVNADEIKLPVDDPAYGGGLINTTPNPGDDPRVTHDRNYGGPGGRRDVSLDPGNPQDQIKIPVRDGNGLLDWLWKFRLLLDVTPA